MDTPVGTCSLCGGTVTLFTGAWGGINPPVPTCSRCRATPILPVMQMGNPIKEQRPFDARQIGEWTNPDLKSKELL